MLKMHKPQAGDAHGFHQAEILGDIVVGHRQTDPGTVQVQVYPVHGQVFVIEEEALVGIDAEGAQPERRADRVCWPLSV
jgi:hypothetical protein